MQRTDPQELPLKTGEDVEEMMAELFPVIFAPDVMPRRTNKADGEDLVETSAVNFYEGVTQQEVENYYASLKDANDKTPPSWGLNSKLVKENGVLKEKTWRVDGMYDNAIRHIVE